MSDALLTEISKKLSDIHAALSKGAAPTAAATTASKTATTTAPKTATTTTAPKTATTAAAAPKNGKGNNAPSAPPDNTKAAGGKHDLKEVRDILRQVATNPSLGAPIARGILDENGGVDHINKLKPENYDACFEAAQVELSGQAKPATDDNEDDGLGL